MDLVFYIFFPHDILFLQNLTKFIEVGRTVVAVNLGLLVTVDKGRLASEDDLHLLKGFALGLRVE